MSIVALPNLIGINGTDIAATKSSIIETPVTISGFIIGTFVTDMTAVLMWRFLIAFIPNAAKVPISVARSEEMTARESEFLSAVSAVESLKSSLYQCREKVEK